MKSDQETGIGDQEYFDVSTHSFLFPVPCSRITENYTVSIYYSMDIK